MNVGDTPAPSGRSSPDSTIEALRKKAHSALSDAEALQEHGSLEATINRDTVLPSSRPDRASNRRRKPQHSLRRHSPLQLPPRPDWTDLQRNRSRSRLWSGIGGRRNVVIGPGISGALPRRLGASFHVRASGFFGRRPPPSPVAAARRLVAAPSPRPGRTVPTRQRSPRALERRAEPRVGRPDEDRVDRPLPALVTKQVLSKHRPRQEGNQKNCDGQ